MWRKIHLSEGVCWVADIQVILVGSHMSSELSRGRGPELGQFQYHGGGSDGSHVEKVCSSPFHLSSFKRTALLKDKSVFTDARDN